MKVLLYCSPMQCLAAWLQSLRKLTALMLTNEVAISFQHTRSRKTNKSVKKNEQRNEVLWVPVEYWRAKPGSIFFYAQTCRGTSTYLCTLVYRFESSICDVSISCCTNMYAFIASRICFSAFYYYNFSCFWRVGV